MADSVDLELLKSGELDLSRCDLRGADLRGMDLRGRNFSHCLLEKAQCEGTNFAGSDFSNSKVSFMTAKGAIFDKCNLSRLHFGYTDLSGASLKEAKADGARFQHAKLDGSNLQGASLVGGSVDADTLLDGVISDEKTNFDGLEVLRPTSRNPLFRDYTFSDGTLHRRSAAAAAVAVDEAKEDQPVENLPASEHQQTAIAKSQIQQLIQNATLTRLTAQQFAGQIEEALRDTPVDQGNRLAEPLQTMLEFAEVLRNLAPSTVPPQAPLDRSILEARIVELETLVNRLKEQLSDETKARKVAENLAKSDGFMANFRRSAGKAAGIGTASVAASLVTVGVPTAAMYFLGADHPIVTTFLTVIGRSAK